MVSFLKGRRRSPTPRRQSHGLLRLQPQNVGTGPLTDAISAGGGRRTGIPIFFRRRGEWLSRRQRPERRLGDGGKTAYIALLRPNEPRKVRKQAPAPAPAPRVTETPHAPAPAPAPCQRRRPPRPRGPRPRRRRPAEPRRCDRNARPR